MTPTPSAPSSPQRIYHPNHCRDTALHLAAIGYHVFPLVPGGKLPTIKDWPNLATTNPETIEKWWTNHNFNIGIATGHGMFVIDLDVKRGADGPENFDNLDPLEEENRKARVWVGTPTKGHHLYYRSDAIAKNSASALAPGVDVRGHHGYVVGPGSIVNGKMYVNRLPPLKDLPPAPAWLIPLVTKGKTKSKTAGANHSGQPLILLDATSAIRRAVEYLTSTAPLAIEGNGGDATTYKVAARLKDLGLSPAKALELLLEHWNDKCQPPWHPSDLATKLENAFNYGQNPPGSADPAADFDQVDIEPAPNDLRPDRFKLYPYESTDPDLSRNPLVHKWLDHNGLSVLYGSSNTGKTFVALEIARCVAFGQPFFDHAAEQGSVVYVPTEAGVSLFRRTKAQRIHFGEPNKRAFDIIPTAVDLLHPNGDTTPLIEALRQAANTAGPLRLVVIDTLSRALAGGNENSSEDMGALVKNIDRIRAATGAHVLIVHHSGKDAAKGARGHSLLRAAVDTEMEIADGVLRCTKQRDGEYPPEIAFQLLPLQIGTNPDGTVASSCVVVKAVAAPLAAPADDFDDRLTREESLALSALEAAALWEQDNLNGDGKSAKFKTWRAFTLDEIRNADNPTKDDLDFAMAGQRNSAAERKLHRNRDSLIEKGCITQSEKGRYKITETD